MTALVMLLQILTDKLKNGGRLVIPVGECHLSMDLLALNTESRSLSVHVLCFPRVKALEGYVVLRRPAA
jgi:protein-L-isoaspartate O-methyltransferase